MRSLVCIVGMHRSGTSAVAGCLKLAGVDFGPESLLMRPSPANPKGYFESLEVVGIHERLLRGLGARWDDPQLRGDWWLTLPARVAQRAITDWLSRLNRSGPSGIKDPRMTLFGPLWRAAARDANVSLRPLVVMREADAVARSLMLRNSIQAEHARDLMLWYGWGATDWLDNTSQFAASICFEELLADPAATLLEAWRELGLPSPWAADWRPILDFVDPELTHA